MLFAEELLSWLCFIAMIRRGIGPSILLAHSGLLLQPPDIGDDLSHFVLGDVRQGRHIAEQPVVRANPLFHR